MLIKKRRNYSFFIIACLFVFILNLSYIAQDIESKVDEYINAYVKQGKFSGSILIAQKGKVLVSKGYGMANYEHDVPNTPQTKFRIASMTKQFTSMAIMQLQEKGLLDVNDPIIKYIPDYPETGKEITIHHLLTHTSGVPNLTSFPDYFKTMMIPTTVEDVIDRFKDKELEITPGEKYEYSNSGYILLGYLVEKVSGKSYEKYIQENIFQPLGMKDTGYDHHSILIKNRAAGYGLSEDGLVNAAYIDMTIPHGAGALYSTAEDLYTWHRALYTEKLVKKDSLDKIFAPHVKRGESSESHYGYGWVITSQFDRKLIAHAGGINGFRADILRYVDDDVCIVVLSNLEIAPAGNISRDLAAILFGEEYELPEERKEVQVDPKIFDAYVGEYEYAPDLHIVITRENDQLYAQVTRQPKVQIYPESENKFFYKVVDQRITFVKNEKGEVNQLILHQGSSDFPAKKIK